MIESSRKQTNLSKSEYEILSLLWLQEQGLTASEINSSCENKSWKDSSIHLIINSMLEKDVITVDGLRRSGRVYSRVFKAAITPEGYSLVQIQKNTQFAKDKSSSITKLFSSLISSDEINYETISKIEELLKEKKEGL